MLYYTRGWPPTAVYGARFLFVPGIRADEAVTKLAEARRAARKGEVPDELSEETAHALLFLRSFTGLTLSGLRFAVRLLWMIGRVGWPVRVYYRLRTHFYAATYVVHEGVLGQRQASKQPDRDKERRVLKTAERKVIRSWFQQEPVITAVIALGSPILALLGWLVAKTPTLVTTEWDGSGLRERNHSLGADPLQHVGSVGTAKQSWVGRLAVRGLRVIQLERIRPCSFDDDLAWLRAKTEAERRLYPELRLTLIGTEFEEQFPTSYEEYLGVILAFVAKWIPPGEQAWKDAFRVWLVQDLAVSKKPAPEWAAEDPVVAKLVNFFYMHGN